MESYLNVNLDYIDRNIENIRALKPNKLFCAVLKANAYGLGLVPIAQSIEDKVDYFAVARLEEAICLRKSGIKKPIILLGYIAYNEVDECIKYDVDIPIYDLSYAKKINENINNQVNVHIAIDSGHGRLGFRENQTGDILALKNLHNLNIIGIFSHYSTADELDPTFTNLQNERFQEILTKTSSEFNFKYIHIENSAGSINVKSQSNMMRVGLALYGLYPSVDMQNKVKLYQSFELKTHISFVKNVEKGIPISYGRTYVTEKNMKIATIPIGYADGFLRSFSNLGEVLIKGKLCRILGRVCMDQIMVDVTGLDVNIDDEVIIYPDIYKEANKVNTITYELLTDIGMRIPRVYIKNGKIIDIINYLGEIYEN